MLQFLVLLLQINQFLAIDLEIIEELTFGMIFLPHFVINFLQIVAINVNALLSQ